MSVLTEPRFVPYEACSAWAWRKIYRDSFPRIERVPLRLLKRGNRFGRCEMGGWEIEKRLVAISVVIPQDTFVYLFFFAVGKSFRGHGIGSAVLRLLQKQYCLPLVLDAEERDKNAPNAIERERRSRFYFCCGFEPSGFVSSACGVRYEMYHPKNQKIDLEGYRKFVEHRIDEYRN